MSSLLRLARPGIFNKTLRLGARRFASEAQTTPQGFTLSFSAPHQVIFKSIPVTQVNVPAHTGDMGILSDHVPTIEQLNPGVVEVIKADGNKKFFISGGFLTMHPNSALSINAVEAFELSNFSLEAVNRELTESQSRLSSAKNDAEKAAAEVEVQLYESLQYALKNN